MVTAGFFLEPWLFLVAAASYVALVLITYFDEAEAHRVAGAARPPTDREHLRVSDFVSLGDASALAAAARKP